MIWDWSDFGWGVAVGFVTVTGYYLIKGMIRAARIVRGHTRRELDDL